ncbi:MAG: hypothetical protein J6V08_03300 [Candidatus Methanomethylophilaceae archaeon]|nr:hypothetical protein [Candidatus Methanomethylophilaceae archaeon]MBO7205426.1 hypothetical protein [Candidatus Methanomethylophilaceae archaeon]
MKVFTSLMKALITIVSLALTIMLITSVAPLLGGGIEVENTEELTVVQESSNIAISGEFTVKSNLPRDITGLTFSIDAISADDTTLKGVNIVKLPERTVESNSSTVIKINESVNIAEVIVFLLADNKDGTGGMYLPLRVSVSADYGAIAGLDVELNMLVKLSDNGTLVSEGLRNSDGEVWSATASFSGHEGDMIIDLVPEDTIEAELYVEGITDKISIIINKVGNEMSVTISTSDGSGLIELAEEMIASNGIVMIGSDAFDFTMPLPDNQVEDIKVCLAKYLERI